MGNRDNNINWDKSNNSIFENFAIDLKNFTNTGRYPAAGSQDVKYGLELQFKRLKEKNLILKYDIVPRGIFAGGSNEGKRWRDDHYISRMEYRTCRLCAVIYRNMKKVYEKNQDSIFYQIITDAYDRADISKDLYSCPNCGAVSRIEVLQSGCPYCATFFDMKELFPKVTNFFFIKDVGYTKKEIKRSIGRVIFPCIGLSIIAYTAYFCINSADTLGIIGAVLSGIFGGIMFGTVGGYFLWAILKLCSIFVNAGKAVPMLVNSAGSEKRFVSQMKRYSSEFSYEYFSDRVTSMLKMIIYSDNAQELPYYEGEQLGDLFGDVIESSYAGAVALKRFRVQGDYCYVTVDVYLDNLYDTGGRIENKNDIIKVDLYKNIREPIDVNFSIEKIQCKSCGSSFNAARQRKCPNCGTQYEIGDDDWVIVKMKKRT